MRPTEQTQVPIGGFERRLLQSLTELDQARAVTGAVSRQPRRPGRQRRAMVAVSVVGVVLMGAGVAAGGMLALRSDSAQQVAAGSPVVMKGSDCAPGSALTLWLDEAIPLGSTTVRADGLFIASVTVPVATDPGAHELRAICIDPEGAELVQTLPLEVTAAGQVELLGPAFVAAGEWPAGGLVAFKGAGCRPDTPVTITVAGMPAIEINTTAAEAGQFLGTGFMPAETAVGSYRARAECLDPAGRPFVQRAELIVVPPEPADPEATKPADPEATQPAG